MYLPQRHVDVQKKSISAFILSVFFSLTDFSRGPLLCSVYAFFFVCVIKLRVKDVAFLIHKIFFSQNLF